MSSRCETDPLWRSPETDTNRYDLPIYAMLEGGGMALGSHLFQNLQQTFFLPLCLCAFLCRLFVWIGLSQWMKIDSPSANVFLATDLWGMNLWNKSKICEATSRTQKNEEMRNFVIRRKCKLVFQTRKVSIEWRWSRVCTLRSSYLPFCDRNLTEDMRSIGKTHLWWVCE